MRRRRFWGWGYEGDTVDPTRTAFAESALSALLGRALTRRAPPTIDDVALRPSRVALPSALTDLVSTSAFDRVNHTYGKSYRDLVRAQRLDFACAPDLVAFPSSESEVTALLDAAGSANVAVIPFGGGTSVHGGVEARGLEGYAGVLSLDLSKLGHVLEIDDVSCAARIEAGIFGPDLERTLGERGFTLRHFPQSFELSTLGGWIATRAGGHFATLHTHIDDFVEGLRVVTPRGHLETRRLPASGAGPDAARLFIGSEGALGVITEAWMRIRRRPEVRASATIAFASFEAGLRAVRELAQTRMFPTNLRLYDKNECLMNGVSTGGEAVLFLGFESVDEPLDAVFDEALARARDLGGIVESTGRSSPDARVEKEGVAPGYKRAFFQAPYLRDEIVLRDVFVETYETATTWDRFAELDAAVRGAIAELGLGPSLLACRITHAYADGCAPYYTLVAAAQIGREVAQWDEVKRAVTSAMVDNAGTTTHHHSVGRDGMPEYERERDPLFGAAWDAMKSALDPVSIMNPGVLSRVRR